MTKAWFKTLFIRKSGEVFIITQDSRRRKNIITGSVKIFKLIHQPWNAYNAKTYGCNLLVREK